MRETRPASDLLLWAGNELGKVHPGGFSSPPPSWDPGWSLGTCQGSALLQQREDGGDDAAGGHHMPLEKEQSWT